MGRSNSRIRRREPKVGRVLRSSTSWTSGGRRFLRLVVRSTGKGNESGSAALLEAAQPLADRGHGGGEEPRGGFNPALLGAFHQPQTMVVGVFHLTHQIEVTRGSRHGGQLLAAARRPALPPAGRLSPTAASHLNTSGSLGGYDVSRLFQE